jgi:hypothetical protein
MTPKEKAENIINWFSGREFWFDRYINALILVNMFIKYGTEFETREYWQDVKDELIML